MDCCPDSIKNIKKVGSEKVISLDRSEYEKLDHKHEVPLRTASKNKIKLPPIEKEPEEPLKFSIKKVRIPGSEKKIAIGSKKMITINEKENSFKLIEDNN